MEDITPIPDGWTTLHGLAVLYMIFARDLANEGDIDEGEAKVILQRIVEKSPGGQAVGTSVLQEAADWWGSIHPSENLLQFGRLVGFIKNSLPLEDRLFIIKDLTEIALVDGSIDNGEHDILHKIAIAWAD